ncbi:MAG: MBL fold metallo-hydrolase [Nitrospirae bacterium]|nr:MAG: MBL fold metallo-hydrolase [Nitrospirota bacterium]
MYRHQDRFLFFDPWLVPWFAEAPVPSLWTSLLPKPAAIFLTHDHDDHVDPRTLLAFPKETPVIVPSKANRVTCILTTPHCSEALDLPMSSSWPMGRPGRSKAAA